MPVKRINLLKFRFNNYSTSSLLNTLNSAQVAFSNRLNINEISPSKLLIPLSPPKENDKASNEFLNLLNIGNLSLNFFTREYLQNRFPSLDEKYLKIGMEVFLEDKNLLHLAKFLGIDAVCEIEKSKVQKKIIKNKKRNKIIKKQKEDTGEDSNFQIQLDCFKALIGLIGVETGPLNLRNFLDSRYFNNSLFNPKDFIRPLYPIPDLSKLFPNLVFRLHQESGRLSSNSIFIIGVYADKSSEKCLGEGFGASQALAQHRAATEALRNLFLSEKRINQRPSDAFSSISDIINPINKL